MSVLVLPQPRHSVTVPVLPPPPQPVTSLQDLSHSVALIQGLSHLISSLQALAIQQTKGKVGNGWFWLVFDQIEPVGE